MTRRFTVVEDSMRPTLEPGDWLVARRIRRAPPRGAIVVFSVDPGTFLVKRAIGLPGERVAIADGQVHIDGATLAEPWVSGRTVPDGEFVVPSDALWVLGDNRSLSAADSRSIGAVPLTDVGWRVMAIYWPAARAALV
jgi:signal peptidase I